MRDVKASLISDRVRDLFMEANVFIGKDVLQRLKQCEELRP